MSIETVQHLEREIARLQALQAEALVAVASADRVVDEFVVLDRLTEAERLIRVEDAVREEVAAALRWSPATADRRIQTARLLAGHLGEARQSLAVGQISMGHVAVLVEAVGRLPGALDRFRCGADGLPDARAVAAEAAFTFACAELQRRVLPTARRGTLSMTRAAARRAVLAIDADGQRQRRERARCMRDVYLADGLDGISTLVARLATEDAHAVLALVDGAAAAGDLPELTVGERRAEALAALVLHRGASLALLDTADSGQGVAVQARVDVVVDLPTLLGLADHPAEMAGGHGRADLVHPDAIRDFMADPRVGVTLRRLVTDPITGYLLDVGRRSYQVPTDMRRFLVARDGTCRFPGCARRAEGCQLDHAQPWDDGGDTSIANLGALCTRHHQLKTHAGWEVTASRPDGSCTWRSPAGRTYENPARPVLRDESPPAPMTDPEPPRREPDPPPF
jgi:hypothetical protein